MKSSERRSVGRQSLVQLLTLLKRDDEITILAGDDYREHLVPALQAKGFVVNVPMEGRRIGEQKSWLINPHAACRPLYSLLDDLSGKVGGSRKLGKACGRDKWPERGIYFFS